jgi:flagellar assembly protein FliH
MMSWSDQGSKIVKNAHILETYKLKAFDADLSTEVDENAQSKGSQESFVALDSSEPASHSFSPLQHQHLKTEPMHCPGSEPEQERFEAKSDEASPTPEIIEIRRKAQEEMERLKEETCHNCTIMEKDAWEKGFKNGETEGIKAGERKAQPLIASMNTLLSEIALLKSSLLTQYEREILELIFSVSEKIMHCEISLNQRVIQETVLHTLQLASEKEGLVLRLNPEDIRLIETLQTSSADPSGKLTAVSLKPDPSVSRGGCHLETPHGDIDASIETRLKRVYQTLIRGFEEQD